MKYILVLILILFSLPALAHKNPGNDLFLRGYQDKLRWDIQEARNNASCEDEYDSCQEVDLDEIEQDVKDLRNYTNLTYPLEAE